MSTPPGPRKRTVTPSTGGSPGSWIPSASISFQTVSPIAPGTGSTSRVVLQVEARPHESVAVTVIICVPRPTFVPGAGDWTTVTGLPQLSVATTAGTTSGITPSQFPSARTGCKVGQLSTGGVVSLLLIVQTTCAALLQASTTEKVIVFMELHTSPTRLLTIDTVTCSQWSIALTGGITGSGSSQDRLKVWLDTPTMMGGVRSSTVQVSVQEAWLPQSSIAV